MQSCTVVKQISLWGLAGFGAFCLTLLLLCQWPGNPLKHQIQSTFLGVDCSSEDNTDFIEDVEVLKEIERVIDIDRRMVRSDMIGYQYPNGNYNISASKFEDLVIEKNGQPLRSLIVTSWRSGSTFLNDILASHPGSFHHFEPLADFGMIKIRDDLLAAKAIKRIRALLNCDYSDLQDDFVEHIRRIPLHINSSTYLWDQCTADSSICFDHRYLSALCKLFPFQAAKLTRVRLNVVEELLADEKLAVRVVLLVRDPRGTLQSRKHFWLCPEGPDCSEAALLCADLVSDYKIAVKLMKKYPDTFRVLRYEDLAADPYEEAKVLFKFLGREFHPKVKEYLNTHTKTKSGDEFSTFRNTKTTPYHWRTDLEFEEVEEIQESCALAIKYWGYLPAMNATHLREFHPVTDYDLS